MYALTVLRIHKTIPDYMQKLCPTLQTAYVDEVYTDLKDTKAVLDTMEKHIAVYFGGDYERVADGDDRILLLGENANYVFQWFDK